MKKHYLLANSDLVQSDLKAIEVVLNKPSLSSLNDREKVLMGRCKNVVLAEFPENWSVKEEAYYVATCFTFFDEKGRPRVRSVFANPYKCHVIKSFTEVYTRYYVKCIDEGEAFEHSIFRIALVDRADNSIVYSAGTTELEPSFNVLKRKLNRDSKYVRMCEEYADKHFPDWKNCLAYWE